MQQHNQVFVIQVSSGAAANKPPLALPAPGPDPAVLPSEVKYSASLVRGLGLAHLLLGAIIFLLGVLGTWVEPETCWAGAGVWTGLSALLCGLSGVVAHCFWYKNFSIKAFLVTSVVCVVLSVLAIVLSIYGIVNRHKHFQTLLDEMDQHSWFQPYDLSQQHRLTLNVSANLLVGFFLELGLALWSSRVGWRGVQTPEFSAACKREGDGGEQHSVTPLPPRPGQQVPLAALYQLLQAHPEMLGNKSVEAGLVPPWVSGGLGDHPTHHSMDYHERVNRFLSHAIEDQNPCLSRPLSALRSENRDSSSTSTLSGGRCSPADTLPMPPPDQTHTAPPRRETMEREMQERYASSQRKVKQTHDKLPSGQSSNERKVKETHVDTLSSTDTTSERRVKQARVDKLPNEHPTSKRKVKETHVDTQSNRESSSERKEKVTHVDTLLTADTDSKRKVKETHVDKVPNGHTASERKEKVTHVDTLSNGDTGSIKKVKEAHTTNGHTSERKEKITHVDTLSNGDTGSIKKVKDTLVDTFRPRRGSEHKPKAPVPKVKRSESLRSSETSNKDSVKDETTNNVDVTVRKSRKEEKKEAQSEAAPVAVMEVAVEKIHKEEKSEVKSETTTVVVKQESTCKEDMTKTINDVTDPNVHSKKADKTISDMTDPNVHSKKADKTINDVTDPNVHSKKADKTINDMTDPNVHSKKADKTISDMTDPIVHSKKGDKTEKHKKKKSKRVSESTNQETKPRSSREEVSGHTTENTDTYKSEKEEKRARKERKERKEKRKRERSSDERGKEERKGNDVLTLPSNILPPCGFEDN